MLRLSILGSFRLSSDETPIALTTPQKTLQLLAYLLLNRQEAFTRDQLASALWPDRSDADARGQLRRYLYRLRQLLPAGDWLLTRGEHIQWNVAADYWLDVEEFEREIGGPPDRLRAALALYTGDLLLDLYEDWIIIEREQLRELYLGGLQRLLDHYRDQRAYDRAITCALQILKREPLRENIVRELMQLRAASGDRNRALADYRQFQQRVIEELGAQPLPETIALYEQLRRAAIAPDTRPPSSAAPGLRARPVKVPAPLTRLLGREQELNAVCDLLQSGECGVRLVTLTGPGGTGKTRLAQAAAQRLAQQPVEFEDGLYYVSLSSLTSPDFVLPAIAKALEVPENSQRSLNDAMKETLRHKDLLLILDNFEHLLEAAPLITDLLAVSTDLRVLVTSREALHVYGEHEYEVPPLPLPDLDHLPPPNELLNGAAIALFVERAHAVKADFVLTPDNAAAVAEICVRLDGLPLAIELAAARSKLFTPQAMLQRLTDRLRFLVGPSRDRPDRQRTLRNVIDWSYNLLSDEEKRLFARLSVFAGSFTAEAVRALGLTQTVWIGGNPPDVMERLSALIDKNMLRAVKLGEAEQESRFRMLLTLREYAQECLSVRGELETLQNRHLQYRLALAQESAIGIGGAQQVDWLRRLDADRDNFRAVLSWALERPNRAELGLQLTVALGKFWTRHGDWTEGAQWLKRALAQNPQVEPVWRARALNIASELADLVGNTSESDTLAAESLALFRALGERRGLADALCNMGGTRLTQNDHARAEPLLLEALALYRNINSPAGAAQVLSYLGMLAKEQADFERAAAYFEESLELNRQLDDTLGMAQNLGQLSFNAYWQGDYARAADLGQRSLAMARRSNSRRAIALALDGVGAALSHLGQKDQAWAYLSDSLTLYRELGNKTGQAMVLTDLALSAMEQGKPRRAASLYLDGLDVSWQIGDRRRGAFCLEGLGQLAVEVEPERAAMCLSIAQRVRQVITSPLPPPEKQLFDQAIAQAKTRLSGVAFETAWQWGQTTPIDQIVVYLLAQTPDSFALPDAA